MTPGERQHLADRLTAATGEPWSVAERVPGAATVEGAARVRDGVSVLRVGSMGQIAHPDRVLRQDIGRHVGRRWLPSLVEAAVTALRA